MKNEWILCAECISFQVHFFIQSGFELRSCIVYHVSQLFENHPKKIVKSKNIFFFLLQNLLGSYFRAKNQYYQRLQLKSFFGMKIQIFKSLAMIKILFLVFSIIFLLFRRKTDLSSSIRERQK